MAEQGSESGKDLRTDKWGIGFGSMGYNLGMAGFMTYLAYFYTDNMLISAASVSMILFFSRIIDAFSDLWMGILVDRCKSRYGKARPWLLWMSVPAAISIAAVYYVPAFSQTGRAVYAFITYNLMAFFFLTAMALPLNSLVSLITRDAVERLKISQIFGFANTLGAVFVNLFATKIMLALGGGNAGYFRYFAITALVGVSLMVLCYKLTRERVSAGREEAKLPVKIALGAVFKNKYWWNAVGIYLMTSLVPSCWSAAAYYCKYWVDGAVDVGELMSLMWGGITVGVLLFIPVSKRFSKSDSAAIGMAIQAFGSVLLWFAPTSVAMVWISTIFRSVGVGGLVGNMRAMLADVVEYGEWKTRIRTEGMVFSGASFGLKVGAGLGTAIVMAIIAWGGYDAGQPIQTDKAMTSIKLAFIAAPFFGSILTIIMLLVFRIEKLLPGIKEGLTQRQTNIPNS